MTNNSVYPKKVLCALPPALLDKVDAIAYAEHRTRSDLIRESLRRYIENYTRRQHELNAAVIVNSGGPVFPGRPAATSDNSPAVVEEAANNSWRTHPADESA